MKIKVTVKRGKEVKIYKVPFRLKMRVLDALLYIQENQEPDLAFRWNCGEGICGSCAAEVNGKAVLMCKEEVKENTKGITIEPLSVFPVIKDLVTDPSDVYKKLDKLKPYYTGAEQEKRFYKIFDKEIKETQEMRKCINCFICYDSCHVIRNHPDLKFTGPMNIVKAVAFDKHPKEKTGRAGLLEKEGLWNCNVTRCCTQNCPQKIKITENAIIWSKERSHDMKKGEE
ncbi:MAG: 2Fe-2S iron-sulfur cluster binding domain-containing protein [Candidatus Aenigmarchaeota archaeon]|nr:2Fe-2S iron-sulfur cluster binding domain-containing protein [Candidatus Aenigmarchaeota archaeon]